MTLQELYAAIEGDYEQATRILRMDKLIDKHIRKFENNEAVKALIAAGDTMDPTALFESAHAVKGVCGNLGLVKLADAASAVTEEFRPGAARKLSDDEVKAKLAEVARLYDLAVEGIRRYAAQ